MIRVIIVDDEELVATSLSTLLNLESDIKVLGQFGSGEDLLQWWNQQLAADKPVPDICVNDLQLGAMDGIATAEAIRKLSPHVKTLIVTSHPRPRALKRALISGIHGFIPKTATAQNFAQAIRTIAAGKRYTDPELAALTVIAGESPLTERETEVIEAAGQGGSIEEIAATAHLAVGTTRNYLSSAISKLGAQNRFDAYLRARAAGWI